jgi:tetratricopeptide (TPR) repeat protein
MDKSNENENENFEDCVEGKKEEDKQTDEKEKNIESEKNDEDKTIPNDNDDEDDTSNSKEKKKYIPYTMQQAQEKEEDSPFPESDDKNDSDKEEHEEKVELSEQEKKDIEEKIINERKNAGDLYKNKQYIQALNIYSLLLKDAQRADLKEQCCILNCNKGICFNKLNDYDKALDSFKSALRYNKDYSKALCNKMLLLNKKEEYLEAYEDFKRLKTLDYNLWENYRHMENGLAYQAEIQKKKMTDDMLGKLKDVGNTILGKFGLSLNNFQMTPNGQGGYSIQYNNNK